MVIMTKDGWKNIKINVEPSADKPVDANWHGFGNYRCVYRENEVIGATLA